MESAPKKQRVERRIEGYFHNVSPIKNSRSGTKYFNAKFQEETSFTDLVCFSPEKHKVFTELQKARSPVSLQNADKVPSLRDTSKFDIRVSATTQVTTPQKQLTFRYEAPVETQDKIGSLSKLNIYQKVCVQAKVVQKGEPEQITTKLNKTLLKCDAIIGDNSGTIKLTLWEQDISKINATNSYRMTNLTIREFENCKTLTSSYDSTFEQITDIGQIRDDNSQSLTESETVNATLLSVSCSSMNSCVSCKKKSADTEHRYCNSKMPKLWHAPKIDVHPHIAQMRNCLQYRQWTEGLLHTQQSVKKFKYNRTLGFN